MARSRSHSRRRWPVLLVVVVVIAAVAVGAWALMSPARTPAPKPGTGTLVNTSLAKSYAISAPSNGQITDGGFIFQLAAPEPVKLTSVQLLDRGKPSALHLETVKIMALTYITQALGVRQGTFSAQSPAHSTVSLARWAPDPSIDTYYEVLLGLGVPKGNGPWAAGTVEVTYSVNSVSYYSIFPHELSVCSAAQVSCSAFGVASGAEAPLQALESTGACKAGVTSWVSGKPVRAWLATNVHSPYWEGSGGNITLSTTKAASYSIQASNSSTISGTADAGLDFDVFSIGVTVSAETTFGVAITHTVSTTSSWQYTLTVPPNAPTERATVYIYGWSMPVTTETTAANCSASYSYGTVYAPDAHTNPGNDYCIAVETYPGVADLGSTCHSG